MKRTQALVVALASLTLCSSLPQEAREAAAPREGRPVDHCPDSSDPQAIGCPPKGFGWILLATAPIWLAVLPVYLVVKGVSWIFKKKEKPSKPRSVPPVPAPSPRRESPRPAPGDMTLLPDFGICVA